MNSSITVSLCGANMTVESMADKIIERTDVALYLAENKGRNHEAEHLTIWLLEAMYRFLKRVCVATVE